MMNDSYLDLRVWRADGTSTLHDILRVEWSSIRAVGEVSESRWIGRYWYQI